MTSNFDFLQTVDKDLYSNILDAEKLFQDEYLNQCAVQIRIFSEKIAKKILGEQSTNLTFDDTINCLKDKIKSPQEQEFVNDLFFIKKIGNKCAHGEDATVSEVLDIIHRAFEIAINYAQSKNKNKNFNKLIFDDTLLVTGKRQEKMRLVDKYVKRAEEALKEDLNKNNNNEISKNQTHKKNNIKNVKKEKIKEKVKQAKTTLKKTINKKTPKTEHLNKQNKNKISKQTKNRIAFLIFYIISLIFLTKIIFCFIF